MWEFVKNTISYLISRSKGSNKQIPPHNHATLIWAPISDPHIEIIVDWLSEISIPPNVALYKAIGTKVKRSDIFKTLNQTKNIRRIKIFIGHGHQECLLGLQYPDCIPVKTDIGTFANLYDKNLISVSNSSLYALCCNSATTLGNQFVDAPNKSFLGYIENIGFEFSNQECIDKWKEIIIRFMEKIINDGMITRSHEELLLQYYDLAYSYFKNGDGIHNEASLEMLILLKRQIKYLKLIMY